MSKIQSADDLARVDTLGFRGEALHAIGAVSSLALTTCERGAELGTRVIVFAGTPIESTPAAHQPGTTVEVCNLFLNLPVRRGFLGTQRAEANASYDNGTGVPRPPRSRRHDDRAIHSVVREACEEEAAALTLLRFLAGRGILSGSPDPFLWLPSSKASILRK